MILTNSINGFDGAQELLIKLVEQSPDDWETRKRVVQVLYDAEFYREAAKLVWGAPEIPPVTDDIAFTARVVSMGQPERAVRLVSTMLSANQNNPQECMNIAKALMREGLSLQSLRFYGVATAKDISLVDKNFEMALVYADSGDDSWADLVTADDFPWDGPRDMTVEDLVDTEAGGDASAAEMLLNSVTQRVPLKAPVQSAAPAAANLPQATAREPKSMVPPSGAMSGRAEAPVQKPSANQGNEFISLGNQASQQEVASASGKQPVVSQPVVSQPVVSQPVVSQPVVSQPVVSQPVVSQPVVSQPVVSQQVVSQPVVSQALAASDSNQTAAAASVSAPPTPSSSLVQGFKPRPSEGLAGKVPEVVVSAPSKPVPQPVAEPPFQARPVAEEAEDTASVAEEPVASQALKPEAPAETSPFTKNESESSEKEGGDVSDMVANALAERKDELPKAKSGGPFAFIKRMFKGSKPVEKVEDVPDSKQADNVTAVFQASELQTNTPEAETSEEVPRGQVQPNSSPVATTVLRRQEPQGYEPPKELDGRTQLVALAPQDGSVFFDQLVSKYNNLSADQLPLAVTAARDMANVDYLELIHAACGKDLDAFSKLLGLHGVMTEANCPAWVEDMNLLRKGYGDAVLATVVSKYSVAECREILGAVYQRPDEQQAAG